jgi:hypothetical protein
VSEPYPAHIFGMHDRGGEHLMLQKNRRGWVLVTEAIGADPNNQNGSNYTDLSNQDFGVLVRLNNGYSPGGTIPNSAEYDAFARRCGNFAQASPGCQIWIIGNEMNLAAERPGGPNGQVITPALYADCFRKCRNEIRRRPGHDDDQVVVGAVGPWNIETKYPGNPSGDWVKYLADILDLLGDELDGISLHTYTHGQQPDLIFSDTTMGPPFQNRHFHFRAYRDFMGAIPAALRDRPVYLTETDQYGAWRDDNTGWVRNAYREIHDWNQDQGKQPIQALILYRWIIGNPNDPQQVGWAISNKSGVQADWREAMNNDYPVVLPTTKPAYRAKWLQVGAPGRLDPGQTVTFALTVRNDGRRTWAKTGVQAVRLGYRWYDDDGQVIEGQQRTGLPRAIEPGQTASVPAMVVQAPLRPGAYTLELDLVEGTSTWFADKGSPTWRKDNVRIGDRYRVAWLQVDAPQQGTEGATVTFSVRLRNQGAVTWVPTGAKPFNLSYKWLDANHQVVVADGLRTPLGREVAPLEEIALEARVQFPSSAGQYILQMDMVHEFVTWFQWQGSPPHETEVNVQAGAPEVGAQWLEYDGPERLGAGQHGLAYLEVKNTGTLAWPRTGQEAVRLGYRWLDPQGQEVPVAGVETLSLPSTVQPGQVVTLRDAMFLAPDEPGSYLLTWDLFQAGAWLSAQGVAVLQRPVQLVSPEYGVAWDVLQAWPARMPPDIELTAGFQLRNTGSTAWLAGGAFPAHLAYTWFTAEGKLAEPWDTFRFRLPRDVPPGDSLALPDVPFKTPPVLGEYVLRWDLVAEGLTWFFRQGAAPLEVPVEISQPSLFVPWTAEASHNLDDVVLAFDGNPDTSWDSEVHQEPGMWFQVDLGQELVLDRVRVSSPGRGFPLGYRIRLSADGQDWHLVAEKSNNSTNVDEVFAPLPARYLRLEQTGEPDWPATWTISEISVSATNPWAGAQASHYTDDAPQAIDARLGTAWNTRAVKQKPGMWFEVDMGSPRQIERVLLRHPYRQMPRGYVVRTSLDGTAWQEVGRKDDNWGRVLVDLTPVSARYVRVETTNSSDQQPWGIVEWFIWRSSPVWLVGRQPS